jgi:hypothetical protein
VGFKSLIRGYHGTTQKNARQILENKVMLPSRGSDHWLGDGVYFFEDDFYAYKWIVQQCSKIYKEDYSEKILIKEYQIFEVYLNIETERVFDLRILDNKRYFDCAYQKLLQEKNKIEEIKEIELSDGVVINFLFSVLDYNKKYDLVIANFILNKNNYQKINSRLGYIEQVQLCVKNTKIINKIEIYWWQKHTKRYTMIWNDLFYHAQPYSKKNRYNPKKEGYDYTT